jgi:hypothetical protein
MCKYYWFHVYISYRVICTVPLQRTGTHLVFLKVSRGIYIFV